MGRLLLMAGVGVAFIAAGCAPLFASRLPVAGGAATGPQGRVHTIPACKLPERFQPGLGLRPPKLEPASVQELKAQGRTVLAPIRLPSDFALVGGGIDPFTKNLWLEYRRPSSSRDFGHITIIEARALGRIAKLGRPVSVGRFKGFLHAAPAIHEVRDRDRLLKREVEPEGAFELLFERDRTQIRVQAANGTCLGTDCFKFNRDVVIKIAESLRRC